MCCSSAVFFSLLVQALIFTLGLADSNNDEGSCSRLYTPTEKLKGLISSRCLSGAPSKQLQPRDTSSSGGGDDPPTISMSTSLAVVPYNEDAILPHEKPSREFYLAGHKFTIKQDWTKLGVAAVVWDSAVVLAEYLVDTKHLVEGKNVIELGAGTGLTGMVAASLGAHVITTEREEAMDHLRSMIDLNVSDKPWKIKAEALDWTDSLAEGRFQQADVIIGADIIYIEETFQDLLRTILSLAKTKATLVLISCKIRYDRDLRFLKLLKEYFDVSEVLHDKGRDIKLFSAQRLS